MSVKLYIVGLSAPCRSVLMTVSALELRSIEIVNIDLSKKEHLTPEFTKINPEHSVPTLQDGDFGLWESRAIMRYLVGRFGGENNSLYPRDLRKRAVVDRILDKDCGGFNKTMLDDVLGPMRSNSRPTARQSTKVTKAYEWLNREAEGKTFLTGDNVTIADLAVVAGFSTCELMPDMDLYPHAMAWYQRMKELPYYEEVNKHFDEMVRVVKESQ